jgi:hypothetical protein
VESGNSHRISAQTKASEKLIKKVISHGRYVTFQVAEVAVPNRCSGKS